MTFNFLSVYDYLSYIIPGAVTIGAAWYAFLGPRYTEPGAFAAIILVVAAYVVGHAVAALFNWLEPVLWWHPPFTREKKIWGLFGPTGTYFKAEEQALIVGVFKTRYGDGDFETNYDLGYTEIQTAKKGDFLAILNQEIGLYGHMATACVIGVVLLLIAAAYGPVDANAPAVALVLLVGALLFGARYKRFWRRFGEQVVRQVRLFASEVTTPKT